MKTKLQEIREKRGAYERKRRKKFLLMSGDELAHRRSIAAQIAKGKKRVMPRDFKVDVIGYDKPNFLTRAINRFKTLLHRFVPTS